MLKKTVTIINQSGLHARPASEFVLTAKQFSSKITLCREGGEPVNAKSMVRLLAEGIGQGTCIELVTEGDDEEAAMTALTGLIESGFGE